MTPAPSGVVTFLFTDIEGSTGRWEADADSMRSALAPHDKVLRKAIEEYGGFMRDVPTPVGVFQVRAQGLRTEFPPLRTLDTTPGNLRPATTSLIGRDSEVTDIQAAVKAHGLVTLTGVGGVGKTRLATEVAGRLAEAFPDGVWLFELAAVADPAAVPDAVAAVLGITQQPQKSLTDSVAAALEGRARPGFSSP
jgi:class 3 adenylate cyclase